MKEINWLPDDQYAKLKSRLGGRITILLQGVYSKHGYVDYAFGASGEIMRLVEESWDIVRGKDKPLPEPNLSRWDD